MYETLITLFDSPLYFGTQMAIDAGIPENKFQELWEPTESDRTIGKLTLEEALKIILVENNCYSRRLLDLIVQKRIKAKEECFNHLHSEIIPLLWQLKKNGIKIGLISNCFLRRHIQLKIVSYFNILIQYVYHMRKVYKNRILKFIKDV